MERVVGEGCEVHLIKLMSAKRLLLLLMLDDFDVFGEPGDQLLVPHFATLGQDLHLYDLSLKCLLDVHEDVARQNEQVDGGGGDRCRIPLESLQTRHEHVHVAEVAAFDIHDEGEVKVGRPQVFVSLLLVSQVLLGQEY